MLRYILNILSFFHRTKNGKSIEQTPKLRIAAKEGMYTITITKAVEGDSGLYRVMVTNGFNSVDSEARVNVYNVEDVAVKPTFTRISGKS